MNCNKNINTVENVCYLDFSMMSMWSIVRCGVKALKMDISSKRADH